MTTPTPTQPLAAPVALVHFRTLQNGSFKFLKGARRGYWRAIVVNDPAGSKNVRSANVLKVLFQGPPGLSGVTPRSGYYIGHSAEDARAAAQAFNEAQAAGGTQP